MRKIILVVLLGLSFEAGAMTEYQKCDAISTMVGMLFKMRKEGASEKQLKEEAFTFLESASAADKLTAMAMSYRLDERVYSVKDSELKLCLENHK